MGKVALVGWGFPLGPLLYEKTRCESCLGAFRATLCLQACQAGLLPPPRLVVGAGGGGGAAGLVPSPQLTLPLAQLLGTWAPQP